MNKFYEIYINSIYVGCVVEEARFTYIDDLRGVVIEGLTDQFAKLPESVDIRFKLVVR